MRPEDVRRAYDAVAEDYAAYFPDTAAEAPDDLSMVDAFVEAVGTAGDAAVLDAGCGTGRMSRLLADRGCHVEGMDLSPGMVQQAWQHHPDLRFTVGSLTKLPYPDGHFAGVLLWYSIIHTPPAGLRHVFAETARVLRPSGDVLVGFQAGTGVRDVSAAYRRFGHDVKLERYRYTDGDVVALLEAVELRETCRLIRRPRGPETDDQAFVLAARP